MAPMGSVGYGGMSSSVMGTTRATAVPFLVTVMVSPRAAAARICEDFLLNSRAVVSMDYMLLRGAGHRRA
ncbi:hypothetical protein SMICM17S_00832 [Streptomyces microflavus]